MHGHPEAGDRCVRIGVLLRAGFYATALSLILAPTTGAQNARVVSCNSSNGQILEIDFFPPGSTVLNTDTNTRVSMQSCVFRDDGAGGLHLVVADRNGEVLFYENSAGDGQIVLGIDPANPANPNGLSQDGDDNLYGVTSSTGSSSAAVAQVWMLLRDPAGGLAGGYAGPVGYIDSTIEGVQELEESVFVTSTMGALVDGDLLVLASDPPMVMRYRAAELSAFRADLAAGMTPTELTPDVFIGTADLPAGATPRGMDLTQAGNLLISVGEGTILNYTTNGTQDVDFFNGLGNGQFKLATGLQDGALRVFLTDRNRGEVHRFGFAGDGTGILEATVADPESPNGIATTTAAVEFTPAGSGVMVTSTNLMVSTIENVEIPGVTGITEFLFTDIRGGADRPLDLHTEISSLLPAGVEIPSHVRAFPKLDPITMLPTGDETFILLVAQTNAAVVGTIQHIADEELILGYDPDCADPDPTMRPKVFWRDNPDTGEPPIPEGTFINVTNDCGTTHGLTKNYSLFIVGCRDTRTPTETFTAQFDGLGVALANAQCIRNKTRKALERHYETARREFFERNRPNKVLNALLTFQAVADGAPQDFVNCNDNEGGDLRARVGAAIFTLQNL